MKKASTESAFTCVCCLLIILVIGLYLLWYHYGSWPIVAIVATIGLIVVIAIYSSRQGKKMREKVAKKKVLGALDRRLEEKRFEKEQKEKGLVKYVDKNGNVMWGTPEQVIQWKKEEGKGLIIQREIVKIRCKYCNKLYDQTLDNCPHCGGGR